MLLSLRGPVENSPDQLGPADWFDVGDTLGLAGPQVGRPPGLASTALVMTANLRLAGMVVISIALGATNIYSKSPAGADSPSGVTVATPAVLAYAADAPDPDVVHTGSDYFAFSTGTRLASYIQVLCNPSGLPATGWVPCPGVPSGASALPAPPTWQSLGTQNAPGVFAWGGAWVMFYTAAMAMGLGAEDTGAVCAVLEKMANNPRRRK